MPPWNETADQRLKLLAQVFETLATCTKNLNNAKAEFEPSAVDMALNSIGRRFFFSTPKNRQWQEDQCRHLIADAPEVAQKLIGISYNRKITKYDIAAIFKAPPPD